MDKLATDTVIRQIYNAAAGRQPWELALETINTLCEGWAVQLLGVDKRTGVALFSHYAGPARPEAHLAYLRTYQHIDPRAPLVFVPRAGDWLHCHEVISDKQVAESPFYQDFLIPVGARYASALPLVNDHELGVMLVVLRSVGRQPLEPAAVGWLDGLRGHFVEAMAIYRHLSSLHMQHTASQAILDRLSHPVLLVDATHTVRHANSAALAALESRLALHQVDGRLRCTDHSDDVALTGALSGMVVAAPSANTSSRRFLRLRGTDASHRFGISLSALHPQETRGGFGMVPVAMLVLHDGNLNVKCDGFALQELFGLTPAEADVGVLLSEGASAESIASRRGVALSTVRSQLRTLMSKTATQRQGELVRRLMTLPQLLNHDPAKPGHGTWT